MLSFAPELTAQYQILENAIAASGSVVVEIIRDEHVIGISSDLQQVAYGEFRRNVAIEHLTKDGTIATAHIAEDGDDGALTEYTQRVAPIAARNVAKRFAEEGFVQGNGYELRGEAMMLTSGSSPVFVQLKDLVACEVVGETILVWTKDGDTPTLELNNGANGPMLRCLLPKLIQSHGGGHQLGRRLGRLESVPDITTPHRFWKGLVTAGFVVFGFLFAIAFGGQLPLPALKLIGMIVVAAICVAGYAIRTFAFSLGSKVFVDVHQHGIVIHDSQTESDLVAWADIAHTEITAEDLGPERQHVGVVIRLKNSPADASPVRLSWNSSHETFITTSHCLRMLNAANDNDESATQEARSVS